MSPHEKSALLELGFALEPRSERWDKGLTHFRTFVHREGHARVPDRWIENGFRLGTGVGTNRNKAKQGTLTGARFEELNALGMIWDARHLRGTPVRSE